MDHILVVDDALHIRRLLSRYLAEKGFQVTAVADGAGMYAALEKESVDLIILDILLPDSDGLELARNVRMERDVPIIMLTGSTEVVDRVAGLEVGADDYIPKPFNARELLARIRAVLRRTKAKAGTRTSDEEPRFVINFAGWELDLGAHNLISPDGKLIKVTNAEFNLLATFVQHPRRVLSRDQLLNLSHGDPGAVYDRSIDYLVLRLRRIIEPDPSKPKLIKTERGVGYIFDAEAVRR